MKRPIGLILSAIVLSLAALFLLLITALTVFAGVFAGHQPSIATPHSIMYLMLAVGAFYITLAVWAILTVIGILRLRSWARYSILVIGGGLAILGILGAAFSVLFSHTMLPALMAQQPTANPHIVSLIFLFVTGIYLLIAAVGIWWLIYFNLRSIREVFSNSANLTSSVSQANGRFSRTPTAIKILGCFFIFSAVCCLLCVFLPFPAFLFGFIIPPVGAHILYLCFAALMVFMGYGLLCLKEPARLLTIAFLIFGCCNIFLATLPWYQTQIRLYMARITASMPTMPGQAQAMFPFSQVLVIASCIFGVVFYGFIFWLLHSHRAAFQTSVPPDEPMLQA